VWAAGFLRVALTNDLALLVDHDTADLRIGTGEVDGFASPPQGFGREFEIHVLSALNWLISGAVEKPAKARLCLRNWYPTPWRAYTLARDPYERS
jgi:hypothetical protein